MNNTSSQTLSEKILSVPVVMFFLNVYHYGMVPSCAKRVQEFPQEKVTNGPRYGKKIIEGKRLALSLALSQVQELGYVPMRLLAIDRAQGTTIRMALVLVREDCIQPGDSRMTEYELDQIRDLLVGHMVNARVFRNPGDTGGNFIVEAGIFKTMESEKLRGVLQVSAGEFVIEEPDEMQGTSTDDVANSILDMASEL